MSSLSSQTIIIFIIICTLIILLLISFITVIVYKYQGKQNNYYENIEQLKIGYENSLLLSRLEIQEQTFQYVAREIHDNIGQKLTLAKLHLNTLDKSEPDQLNNKVENAVEMIGDAIRDLSDISRSMSTEIIMQNGFIKALEIETGQIRKLGLYAIELNINGDVVFLEAQYELILYRIIQESLNNILKHSGATKIIIDVYFSHSELKLSIKDNGRGFLPGGPEKSRNGMGLVNISKRAKMLKGNCDIISNEIEGTIINIIIPIHETETV